MCREPTKIIVRFGWMANLTPESGVPQYRAFCDSVGGCFDIGQWDEISQIFSFCNFSGSRIESTFGALSDNGLTTSRYRLGFYATARARPKFG
jgi:hypothetical protein